MTARSTVLHSAILLVLMISICGHSIAQPYVDLIQSRYTYGFRNPTGEATPFAHWWIGSDLPIQLGEKSYLLIAPYYEQWQIDSASARNVFPIVRSVTLPIGLISALGDSRWSVMVLPVIRTNGEQLLGKNTFQLGSAFLLSYALQEKKKIGVGVFANREFFGWFVMPLLGIDWRINDRNYLFGQLPGRLTFEHHWRDRIYLGATFRGITNSFRLADGNYLRIDDNQLSVHMDYHVWKPICLTVEVGYGMVRKLRTGQQVRDYTSHCKWGDGPFIKVNGSYRIRL